MSNGTINNLDNQILGNINNGNQLQVTQRADESSVSSIPERTHPHSSSINTRPLEEEVRYFKSPEEAQSILGASSDRANNALIQHGSELRFEVNNIAGTIVTTLVDSKNEETLRQYPSEQSLAVMENIQKFLEQQYAVSKGNDIGGATNPETGLLVDQKV